MRHLGTRTTTTAPYRAAQISGPCPPPLGKPGRGSRGSPLPIYSRAHAGVETRRRRRSLLFPAHGGGTGGLGGAPSRFVPCALSSPCACAARERAGAASATRVQRAAAAQRREGASAWRRRSGKQESALALIFSAGSATDSAQGVRSPSQRQRMLKNASVRLLRDGGFRPSQALLFGCSETVVPLIRRFCSTPFEELILASRPLTKRFNEPKKLHGPSQKGQRHGTKLPGSGGDGSSRKGSHHEKKLPGRDGPFQKGSHHENELTDTGFKPFLFQIVLDTSTSSLMPVLDTWVKAGNHLERDQVNMVLFHLRKQRMYNKALKFMEWIERRELLNFEERDYASHLDLIARNHGIEAAEKYIVRVPEAFRSEVLYETLLVNCVCRDDAQKADQIFNEIRELSLPLTISACNQMLLLYKRVSRSKVVDILTLMEKENIKPSIFTYKLMIDFKGRSNDILGMEAILKLMKENGLEPDFTIQTMVAKFYINGGLAEKAEEAINAMEVHVKANRHAIRSLLDLYAMLGRPDDVERIWKLCFKPKLEDFLAAIKAWGKLGHIERAEETFDALSKTSLKLSSKYFNAMLDVYAENELLDKGKKFIGRMSLDGCPNSPLTWDAVVKLYVNSGELAKADSFLMNVTEDNPDRHPTFRSNIILLKAFAEKGDIHNAEKIFDRLKRTNYPARTLPYNLLLAAYASAQVTPYGFRERMKADKFSPSKNDIEQLKHLDSLSRQIQKG